jgi:hypothetical protein
MAWDQWLESVESRLWDAGRRLWRCDPKEPLRDAVERATGALRSRYNQLTAARAELEALRTRLEENQASAALLGSAVDDSLKRGAREQAWRLALELDRLRRQLADDQARLPKQEQLCWSLDFRLRQFERHVARLQQRLLAL